MRKQFLLAAAIFFVGNVSAQTIINRDTEIDKMVKEVSADSLQSYIKQMVAFGTRNTLSNQTSDNRGIGAARVWVLNKFNNFAKQSNGRLTAVIDTTIYKPDGKRVDRPIVLGNVVATLKGTDPNDNRIFLISGHLDNMRTNVMDSTNDAPGRPASSVANRGFGQRDLYVAGRKRCFVAPCDGEQRRHRDRHSQPRG